MDINASIDVGKNVAELLTRLASQIGVAADKVFPWYVQQQVIEGTTRLIVWAMIALVGVFLVGFLRNKKRGLGSYETPTPAGVGFVAGVILLVMFSTYALAGAADDISRVLNPGYHAMQAITKDIARLR